MKKIFILLSYDCLLYKQLIAVGYERNTGRGDEREQKLH